MSGLKQYYKHEAYPMSRFFPLLAIFAALCLVFIILLFLTELHEDGAPGIFSKLAWRNATVRPPVLLVVIVFGWGGVVHICRDAGLNLDVVFGGRTLAPAATWHAALVLMCIVFSAHLVHFAASEVPGITWRPWLVCNLALHAVLGLLGLTGAPIFHSESRLSLRSTLWESVIAPLTPVSFWHVIVADYLTSLAKAFSDLQLSACVSSAILTERRPAGSSYTPTTTLWDTNFFSCADTYWNALMLALPFWWRLMQCLKVYSVTGEQKNLWNALKYSTAFPLVYAGYLRRHRPSARHDRFFIVAACVQSSYCYFWDVQMDWGLLRRDPKARLGWSLREQLLVTQNKGWYAALCAFNFVLRFVWALTLFGVAADPAGGMFFLEAVEILRRTAWAIFRIEWEVIAKGVPRTWGTSHPMTAATSDSMSEGSDLETMRDVVEE